MVCSLARFTDVRAALAVGGLSLQAQASDLRTKPEVVVATPVSSFFFFLFLFFSFFSFPFFKSFSAPLAGRTQVSPVAEKNMLFRRLGAGRGSFFFLSSFEGEKRDLSSPYLRARRESRAQGGGREKEKSFSQPPLFREAKQAANSNFRVSFLYRFHFFFFFGVFRGPRLRSLGEEVKKNGSALFGRASPFAPSQQNLFFNIDEKKNTKKLRAGSSTTSATRRLSASTTSRPSPSTRPTASSTWASATRWNKSCGPRRASDKPCSSRRRSRRPPFRGWSRRR